MGSSTNFTTTTKGPIVTLGSSLNGPINSRDPTGATIGKRHVVKTYTNNKHQRPISAYSALYEDWVFNPGTRRTKYTGQYWVDKTEYGCTFNVYPQEPSTSGSSLAKARNQALNGFRGAGASIPVMLAEMHDTIGLVTSTLKGIYHFATKAKRMSRLKSIRPEDAWLELRWGWLPLFQDLKGLMNFLGNSRAFSVHISTGRSKDRESYSQFFSKFTDGTGYLYSSGNGMSGVNFHVTKEVTSIVGLHGRLTNATAAKAAALGFTNPLSVIWELVPFSCVADYLLPIGDFLSALDATVGYDFMGGYETRVIRYSYNYSISSYRDYVTTQVWEIGTGSYKRTQMSRVVLTQWPGAQLYFKNPLSTIHCLNVLALVVGAFRN